MDTEIKFDEPIEGTFIDAVYLEFYSCLIICYKLDKTFRFIGYDSIGRINEYSITIKENHIKIDFLCVISRSFFCSRNSNGSYAVFNYNHSKRIVEYNIDSKWRIHKNILCKLLDCKSEYPDCYFFIGQTNQSDESSSFCIYKYDPSSQILVSNPVPYLDEYDEIMNILTKEIDKNSEIGENNKIGENSEIGENNKIGENDENSHTFRPKFKFSLLSTNDFYDSQTINKEDSLLTIRINSNNFKLNVPTMLSYVSSYDKDEEKPEFTKLDLWCALCKLFPFPILVENRLVYRAVGDSHKLSLFKYDPSIYRSLHSQIYGHYINIYNRISFFSVEELLNSFLFEGVNITIIVDKCGLGAKFSNLAFGTSFNNLNVRVGDIWVGFSYSGILASIILLFRIDGSNHSIDNAVENYLNKTLICTIEKGDEKYSLVFKSGDHSLKEEFFIANDLKDIINRFMKEFQLSQPDDKSDDDDEYSLNASFILYMMSRSNTDESNAKNKKTDQKQSDNELKYFEVPNDALIAAKEIISIYLTYQAFPYYPDKTIIKHMQKE